MSEDLHGEATTAATDRALQWREAFDRAFAEPAALPEDDLRDYLGIRLAGQPHALALHGLAGLQPFAEPTPYPASAPGLLGLIGWQGRALPLYDLQSLLDLGMAPVPRWLVVVKDLPLALAFEGFEGQWRLPPRERLGDTVRCGGQLRPLVDLTALVARIAAFTN